MSSVWGIRAEGRRLPRTTCRPRQARLRVRCDNERQPTRRIRQAPDVRVPPAPPPPPIPPPPPPPEEPEARLFGFSRRKLLPFLIGVPLAAVWATYLKSEVIQEEVVASVYVPKKRKNGEVVEVRRDVKLVQGKNGMVYITGKDNMGRTYMVDKNGVLFYDSGMSGIGWYAVEPNGEITNIYMEKGEVKTKYLGNMSSLKSFKVDEFMGIETPVRKWRAFLDRNVKPLPPNVPLVQSARDKSWRPPFFIDEGKITLEEKRSVNPFSKKDGGGKFRLESD